MRTETPEWLPRVLLVTAERGSGPSALYPPERATSGIARLVPLPAAIPSSDETGRYARISSVAILTGSVSLRASRMSAAGFGNTRPITPHHTL